MYERSMIAHISPVTSSVWHRLSACRKVHGESATALPGGILASIRQRKALEQTAASAVPASVNHLAGKQLFLPPPIAICAEGPHQQSRMLAVSTQYQCLQQKSPSISLVASALQQQWDHAANAHMGPVDIKPHSKKKVWWKCHQCPDSHLHSWEATVSSRTTGSGCPQCSGRKVCKHNSLATKAPKVAAQWDYEENVGNPESVVAHSSQPVGWLCETCGQNWNTTPNKRVSKYKAGCPKCSVRNAMTKQKLKHPSFAACQDPHGKAVLAGRDHERNAPQENFPQNTTLRSTS